MIGQEHRQIQRQTKTHVPLAASPQVGFFITCLADFFRPTVGFASTKLLSDAGCQVQVPSGQTCCGQPAYNNGDVANARALARRVIGEFEAFDYIVAPSGSCAGVLKRHYPDLFRGDPEWAPRAERFAERCFEITSFLVDICAVDRVDAAYPGVAAYHDSCSGLRELGIHTQPRLLLASVASLEVREMAEPDMCCGFGGTFCIKYPELSTHLVSNKAKAIRETEATVLLGGDLGCLFNIAGRLWHLGSDIKAYHVAEILAGMNDAPITGGDLPDTGIVNHPIFTGKKR